jgi:hypothetical protein
MFIFCVNQIQKKLIVLIISITQSIKIQTQSVNKVWTNNNNKNLLLLFT